MSQGMESWNGYGGWSDAGKVVWDSPVKGRRPPASETSGANGQRGSWGCRASGGCGAAGPGRAAEPAFLPSS